MPYGFAQTCVFGKQSHPSIFCGSAEFPRRAPLVANVRGDFAEFLRLPSFEALVLLHPSTGVGLVRFTGRTLSRTPNGNAPPTDDSLSRRPVSQAPLQHVGRRRFRQPRPTFDIVVHSLAHRRWLMSSRLRNRVHVVLRFSASLIVNDLHYLMSTFSISVPPHDPTATLPRHERRSATKARRPSVASVDRFSPVYFRRRSSR